ncbi:hypothetical protein [Nitrosomonas communis]|uniref:Uncharacterized protein n=1 Tax=Nitrosomonas communis TaxID=44574 RepID=A0A1H2YNM9_9PROT|nr:hypothetical protein [Nitrosomonas communis]SDX06852.1 hypothetical protein SAMN05421882_105510 [Nitrosomonas communis]
MRKVSISILIDDDDRLDGFLSSAGDYTLYGPHLDRRCRNVYVHHGYAYVPQRWRYPLEMWLARKAVIDSNQCAGRTLEQCSAGRVPVAPARPSEFRGEGGAQTGPSGAHSWPL